ncbi:MAG: type II secretion system minor pseudopilin GspI [Rhodocyclaceae bacterium]|nr:type II secretion system minor pseudopilin GspI [Rhodocyclaceae bacterium]MCB1912900.1 type II secretion system minor pseudopilin GspI [Rhodocyclaceae bacterium]MCP5254741.1 type II secretion system minor pseudopilin GspI [Zoogloeaceae bacterium]MCP5294373.1 type II secretion system minor pseudopilin GspI [Zoogloeaceae bacterium]MCW5613469.1 type II secretion system minor pseudopilin GspI [Rhodocyclaceae bacterium]
MNPARLSRGFTLLETLVALAILAIALSAAFRAVGATTGSAEGLRDRLLADWVAQNRLAELRAAGSFPPLGRDQGEQEQAGQQFQWQEEVKGTPNPLFRRIEVTVFDADGKRALSTLSGFAVQPLQ